MKLSIITPCYNAAEFIETTILSVLHQNTEDVELILVNDGSTDETGSICRTYADFHPCHPTVRYYETENKGAGHARNYGIERADGEWIAFLDADDLYLAEALCGSFFDKLSQYHTDGIEIIQTAKLKTDMTLSGEVEVLLPEKLEEIRHHIPMLEFWTCIYRHDFLNAHKIRFYEYRRQDIETAFRYLACSYAERITIDTSMNFYLQRNNLQSNTHTWNTYHLHQIKGSIYYDLFTRTPCKEDRPFLYNVIVEQLIAYYTLCHEHGYDSKTGFETMHALLSAVKKLPTAPQSPELSAGFRQICKWDLKTRLFGVKLKSEPDISSQKNTAVNASISTEELFERLSALSPSFLHIG